MKKSIFILSLALLPASGSFDNGSGEQAKTNNSKWIVNALSKSCVAGAMNFFNSWAIQKVAPQSSFAKGALEVVGDVAVEAGKLGVDELIGSPEITNDSPAEKCGKKMFKDLTEVTCSNAGEFFAGTKNEFLPKQSKVFCKAAVPAIEYAQETGNFSNEVSPIASSVKTLCKYEGSIEKALAKGVAGIIVNSKRVTSALIDMKPHRQKGISNMIIAAATSISVKLQMFALGYTAAPYVWTNEKLTGLATSKPPYSV